MPFDSVTGAKAGRKGGLKSRVFVNTVQLVTDYNDHSIPMASIYKRHGVTLRTLYRYLVQAEQRDPGSVNWRNHKGGRR